MHEVAFNGLRLEASPGRVMTPRRASEQLVTEALARIGQGSCRVVDVGTGSGALAIAIAQGAPAAEVVATDTSRCAVALARTNVRLHGVGDRVTVLQGDLLDPVSGPIDLVVANLPYLPAGDADRYPDLAAEPGSAVFASGDGLDPYRRLLAACERRLDGDATVLIQFHRRMLAARRGELGALRLRLEARDLAAA